MSDIDRLLARFETGTLLRPSPHVPNLVDLARALARLTGARHEALTPQAARLAQRIGPAEHLVVIMADGLGLRMVEMTEPTSTLASHMVEELRTVFPSTTATALTTFATGAWPGQHGVTGQWTHLPEIDGSAAPLLFAARAGGRSLAALGLTVEQVFPLPAWMASLPRDCLALLPEDMVRSVSAAYFRGNQPRAGYRTLAAAIDCVARRIETASGPTYTYLYTPTIDLEAHRYGARHPAARAAVGLLDGQIRRLAERLGGRARLVVTADHGHLDTPVAARHWLKPGPDLAASLLHPPSGDSRVMYLRPRDGAEARVRQRWRERYGDRFLVITTEEAEAIELFGPGPLSPLTRARLGDLIVISAGADAIEYVPNGRIDRLMEVISHHSGLTPAEMRVPLVVI